MKIDLSKISIGIVSLAIGFMLTVQLSASNRSANNISYEQWSKQQALMDELKSRNHGLSDEAAGLRNKLALESSGKQSREFKEKLKQVNIAAGLTAVTGPGLVIKLDDNPDPLKVGDDADDYIIHQINLLFVVNDLRGAGAEAISINDQRIIAGSEIRCAGPTILINTARVAPPYEIKAIGNSESLEDSIRAPGGELQALEARGIKTSILKSDKMVIPALSEILTYRYAQSTT